MPDITMTLSMAAADRIKKALDEHRNLPVGTTTMTEVKQYIKEDLKQLIKSAEKQIAVREAVDGTDPTIT